MILKKLMLPVAGLLIIVGSAFDILSDDGKAGYTGSSGELLCNDCHNTFGNSNSGPGTIYITSTMNNWQYVPGQTYTINVVVKQIGKPLFGFGCEALTASNTNAGTLVVTNSIKTQIKTKTVSSVVRNNIVHQQNGGSTNDSCVFTFNWQAPATNVGNVTFYFAGVAANSNTDEFGDYVYNSSKLATPASATGINEVKKEDLNLNTFVNANGDIIIRYQSKEADQPRVDLYDLNGKIIASHIFEMQGSGNVELTLSRPLEITEGMYIVNLLSGATVSPSKLFIH